MPWTVTARVGGRVSRTRHEALDPALKALEQEARGHSGDTRSEPVDLRVRRLDPAEQVTLRIELAGPERMFPSVRAGVDVHGDGSVKAYTGRVRRQVIEPRRRQSAYEALRAALGGR